jgi:uncharacterized protein with HEPN domain
MQRDRCAYLEDVLLAGNQILTFTADLEYEHFAANSLVRAAVERKFEIIGEALKQLMQLYPGEIAPTPSSRAAMRQRDRIAHGYFAIDPAILWRTLRVDLPPLLIEIQMLKDSSGCADSIIRSSS